MLTQVLEITPFDKVTFINLDLNLSKYRTPRVTEPNITDIRPINIAMYSCLPYITV